MSYENYKHARDAAWQMLIDCHVTSLPVDVAQLCATKGYVLRSYKAGRKAIEAIGLAGQCEIVSGFTYYHNGVYYIFYDDSCSPGRQRFTIAHEIGHIILVHLMDGQYTVINREPGPQDDPAETQANQVAARLLAPACVLHALGVTTANEISQLCGISQQAAEFRAARLRVLNQRDKFLTSPLERKVFDQFKPFLEARSRQSP